MTLKIRKDEVDKLPELARSFQTLTGQDNFGTIVETKEFYLYRPGDNPIAPFIRLLKMFGVSYSAVISEEDNEAALSD